MDSKELCTVIRKATRGFKKPKYLDAEESAQFGARPERAGHSYGWLDAYRALTRRSMKMN